MRRRTPRKTGRLQASIKVFRFPGFVRVSPTAPYASFVEMGVKPHKIQPRKAKTLKFKVNGKNVFAKTVSHPGFSGRFFVRRTGEAVHPKLRELLLRMVFGR